MKKWICLLLVVMLIPLCAVAEEDEENKDTGSWSQINQSISRKDDWVRYAEGDDFRLGGTTPLEGSENLYIGDWGTYPSMDGSTVCVPMAMELARQWLDLPEEDLNGFVNFSTTPYAYDRLIKGSANPLATIKSIGVMMDDTHPIDLVLATYPNADERKAAEDAGVELVYVPFCCDAFIFMVNAENPVKSLTVREIQEIYSGKISSWAMVGGTTNTIEAYQRPHGSGSQTAMEEMVMNGISMKAAQENYISDGMIDAVEQIGNYNNGYNAIGYSYLYYVDTLVDDGGIKVLSVDGISPTPKNLQSGRYPFTVNYYAVYRKGDEQTEAFVNWLTGEEGQKAVAAAGYVPLGNGAENAEEDDDEAGEENGAAEKQQGHRLDENGELTIAEGTVVLGMYESEPDDADSENSEVDPEIKALFEANPQMMFYGDYYYIESDGMTITDAVSKVNWPSSIRVIGELAFSEIDFETLTLPASLERIYPSAFGYCNIGTLRIECGLPYEQIVNLMVSNDIRAFEVPDDHPLFSTVDGVLYSKDGKTLLDYPSLRENEHFDVPEGVEYIAAGAFYNDYLTSVSLPESIKSIGQMAFVQCNNLTRVDLPAGMETLDEAAFYGCGKLESIQLPAGLKTIGDCAFYKCSGLTSIDLPETLETIGEYAFYGCENIKTVHFPDGVTKIGESAFSGSGLTSVTIPKGVTTVEKETFENCEDLEEINLHDGINTIGYAAFRKCSKATSLTIPDGVKAIGSNAFSYTGITSVTIPESVQTIESDAFFWCDEMEGITLLKGVKSIEDQAFASCDKVTEITIPDSVTTLGDRVFAYNNNLICVTIPESVTSIGEELFFNCRRTPYCNVTEGSYAQEYCEKNGIVYRISEPGTSAENEKPEFPYRSGDFRYVVLSDGTAAIVRADTGTKCVIPREVDGYTVSAVGLHYANFDVHEINRAVEIEDEERHYFRGVVNPECTSIEIPATVKTIGFLALYGCKNLETVRLPEGLTTIGYYAFEGTGLTSVDIPESVRYIGIYAFKDCEQLTEIVIPGSVEELTDGVFESCGSLKEVTIQEGVRSINGSVCGYCKNLRKVVLPESMTKIYEYAFLLCDHVTCVVPEGSYAQKYCEENGIAYSFNEGEGRTEEVGGRR